MDTVTSSVTVKKIEELPRLATTVAAACVRRQTPGNIVPLVSAAGNVSVAALSSVSSNQKVQAGTAATRNSVAMATSLSTTPAEARRTNNPVSVRAKTEDILGGISAVSSKTRSFTVTSANVRASFNGTVTTKLEMNLPLPPLLLPVKVEEEELEPETIVHDQRETGKY